MDELGEWFMGVFTSINSGGKLGPPSASNKRVRAFLEQVGGEGVLKLSTLLNVGNAEAIRQLARYQPDLGEKLGGEEPQKALDIYFEKRVDYFEPCRRFFTRGLSLPAGSTAIAFASSNESDKAGSEVWEKVFQIIIGGKDHDKESGNL